MVKQYESFPSLDSSPQLYSYPIFCSCSVYRLPFFLSNPHPRPEFPLQRTQRSLHCLNRWGFTSQRIDIGLLISCSALWFPRGQACTHKHTPTHVVPTTKGFTASSLTIISLDSREAWVTSLQPIFCEQFLLSSLPLTYGPSAMARGTRGPQARNK